MVVFCFVGRDQFLANATLARISEVDALLIGRVKKALWVAVDSDIAESRSPRLVVSRDGRSGCALSCHGEIFVRENVIS